MSNETPVRKVGCSRCLGGSELHLITKRYSEAGPAGRILVYCARCREEAGEHLGVSIPVELVSPDLFVGLYALGLTESDPRQATRIAFGEDRPEIAARALEALAARSSQSK